MESAYSKEVPKFAIIALRRVVGKETPVSKSKEVIFFENEHSLTLKHGLVSRRCE